MRTALAALVASFAALAWGQSAEVDRPDPVVETRLKAISEELRCLVCQNQTIADSNAPLAVDLRTQIRAMVGTGKSDAEIRAYMVQRYGDFVLYKPPFQPNTILLWLGPAILISGGAFVLAITLRRRRALPAAPVPEASQRREIESLLAGNEASAEKKKGGRSRP